MRGDQGGLAGKAHVGPGVEARPRASGAGGRLWKRLALAHSIVWLPTESEGSTTGVKTATREERPVEGGGSGGHRAYASRHQDGSDSTAIAYHT